MANCKSLIQRSFKLNGLQLSSDGCVYLTGIFEKISESRRQKVIDKVIETILRQPLDSNRINRDVCEAAVEECKAEKHGDVNSFHIIQAFEVPRFVYNCDTKKFAHVVDSDREEPACLTSCLFASHASSKHQLFKERFNVVQQTTESHSLFFQITSEFRKTTSSNADSESSCQYRLQPVEYLLGCTGRVKDIIVLGMLTQAREGKWCLEDPTGIVPLDFSQTTFHQGLFPEGCFVLTEGWFEDSVFHLQAMGLPPAEPSENSRQRLGMNNYFGGPGDFSVKLNHKMQSLFETEGRETMLVFLSDVDLDNSEVMKKLETLMTGFEDSPPHAFVFCGNFCGGSRMLDRQSSSIEQIKQLHENLKALFRLFCKHSTISSFSQLILVPGPHDPGLGSRILPRPPLKLAPEIIERCVGADVSRRIHFGSNPCRIRLYTHELVLMRHDLASLFYRHCLHIPGQDLHKHLARTITSQGHLLPLPLHVAPVYWPWDQALRVYPLPDTIVLADSSESFSTEHAGCKVFNPGSFNDSNQFSFKVYYPYSGLIEDSKVNF